MPKKEKDYRRLPGRGLRRIGGAVAVAKTRASLWLGKDHLLSMDTMWFMEDYKRFYYRDIQAFLIRKTARGKIINLVLSILAALMLLLAVLGGAFWGWGREGWYICGGIALFFLLMVGINALMGPTCICHLQTAVQREELPSLTRFRTARKAVNRLKPLIETAQGTLSPEEIQIQSAQMSQNIPAAIPPAPKPVKHEHGRFHEILFYLLLFDSVPIVFDIFYDHVALTLCSSLVSLAACGMMIIALIRQHGSDITRFVRGITWVTLGYHGVIFLLGYIVSVVITVQNPEINTNNQWEMMKVVSTKMSAMESPWIMGLHFFALIFSLSLGSLGLASLYRFRRDYRVAVSKYHPSSEAAPAGT